MTKLYSHRRRLYPVGMLILLCLCSGLSAELTQNREDPLILSIGFPAHAFSPGFVEDVKAALKVWGSKLAVKYDPAADVVVTIFYDTEAIKIALLDKTVDILVISSLDYIDLEHLQALDPVTCEYSDESIYQEFVFIVRRDRDYQMLSNLKDSRLVIDTRAVGRIPQMWLDVSLQEMGLPMASEYFREVKQVEKASQALLPVFFGQMDGCVIRRSSFETMCELNPQLEKELMVIHTSPGLVRGVSCVRKNMESDLKQLTLEVLNTMADEPEGEQILLLLQVDTLVSFKPEYLASTRELYAKHKALGDGKK